MNTSFMRVIVLLALCGALGFAFTFFPSVQGLQIGIHGLGWPILVAAVIGAQLGWNTVTWYAREFFKLPGMDFAGRSVCGIVAKTFGYLCFAGVFITLAKFLPEYFTVASPAGIYIMFGGLGFVMGVFNVIESRYFPRASK
jgi:hypothetical protein